MRTLIVGGGIAGSALAFALRRAGREAVVAEARPSHQDTGGAFLNLAPNGVNALRSLGLGEVPAAAGGFEVSGLDFHNARGRRIAGLAGEHDVARYGARSVVLRRARLHAELARRAQDAGATFLFGARLVGLRTRPGGVEAVFADGRSLTAEAVIGADGVWSTVRRLVWPQAPLPSYTGIVDCGGWTDVDLPDTARQQMYFGRRAFFAYTVDSGVAYWFTNVPRSDEPGRGELDDIDQDRWMEGIRRLHERDPAEVRAILRAARHSVGAWPVYDMPTLTTWHDERVCLIGDAAHAVSPSSGQGASLAVEDAAVLARRLHDEPHPGAAFSGFTEERKARADKIVRFGRRIGDRKVASATGSLFRDLTLGMFLRMGAGATADQYGHRIPAPPVERSREDGS
ncbi:FAD-dependent oxidoreductase [Micromonospora sp. SH-82]|uniref:FAD-dependent oxidoreductase n=1 Tax=Micromonospora sp. SH-82 TaxID=3132938 RepID=UPI003EBCA02D